MLAFPWDSLRKRIPKAKFSMSLQNAQVFSHAQYEEEVFFLVVRKIK